LADPTDSPATISPTAAAGSSDGRIGPPDADPIAGSSPNAAVAAPNAAVAAPNPAADQNAGADLARRRFFRQFAGDVASTAATVLGAAQALQRTSAELAGAILDPSRAALGEGSVATAVPVMEPIAAPIFRTSFLVDPGAIRFIDQRALPEAVVEHISISAAEVIWAIRNEVVVGGPAVGQAAAIGLALTAARATSSLPYARRATLRGAAAGLKHNNPMVASLGWAVDRVMAAYEAVGELDDDGEKIADAIQAEADAIVAEATVEHGRLVEVGLGLLDGLPKTSDGPLRLLVHGPSGTLAGGQFGTALAIAVAAHHAEREVQVIVPEGRPGLFGARISCWELASAGVPHILVLDAAAAGIVASGGVDAVLVAPDRVAVNGDVAAPIGSYALAAAARDRGVPFLVCMTIGSLDPMVADGSDLPVGRREVPDLARIGEAARAPRSTDVIAPFEDVVPAALVSEYVSATGLRRPPFESVAS
jgi:methylthioribose-1-phosphate isomerase